MERSEADELRAFIRGLMTNIRMNYGYAMSLAGLDPDLIFRIHYDANEGMLDWLQKAE